MELQGTVQAQQQVNETLYQELSVGRQLTSPALPVTPFLFPTTSVYIGSITALVSCPDGSGTAQRPKREGWCLGTCRLCALSQRTSCGRRVAHVSLRWHLGCTRQARDASASGSPMGYLQVMFGFFTKKKPTVQLLLNGEPCLSAINSASQLLHHSSSRLANVQHPAGVVLALVYASGL